MKHANINIDSPKGLMKYFVEYLDNADHVRNDMVYVDHIGGSIDFMSGDTGVVRNENEWSVIPIPGSASRLFMPSTYDVSSVNIYFPRFSVETYEKKVKYAVTINTWVHGRPVYLANLIIDRNNVVAADRVRKFANEDYYECLNIKIIDPWNLVYGEEWKLFRQEICGEEVANDGSYVPVEVPFIVGPGVGRGELNNTGSIINITIHPVREAEENTFIEMDDYHGGQNSINLADEVTDYLTVRMEDNRHDGSYYEDELVFKVSPSYNQSYDQTADGFKQYIKETYLVDVYHMKLEVVIQDDEDVFKIIEREIDTPWQTVSRDELMFDSWDGYHEGLFIRAFLKLYQADEEDAFIYLTTNRILLTQELFSYMVGENPLSKVYLESLDMNNYTINAVNKVQQNVIQMERPDDYKANIIKPVFFRARELGGLVIHPAVTEQICINLDQYKSKVDKFMIKIEDTTFIEFGRTTAGVIFKIVGNNLPNKKTSGLYYILDQDTELVTTGQYVYEQ